MNSEVTWGKESSGTQVQPQIILDPDYLSDYLSVPYDYVQTSFIPIYFVIFKNLPKIPQCLILANFRYALNTSSKMRNLFKNILLQFLPG